MSAAAATAAAAPPKGKKKLLIIVLALVVLLLVGGGAAVVLLKRQAAAAEADDGDTASAPAHGAKHDPKAVPTFVPLDPFTVNLSDREAERYAQVGITLEVGEPQMAEEIKAYMPAIRNNILLALAEKTAAQLMDRDGKAKLAEQIKRETSRAMGYDVPETEADDAAAADSAPAKKKKRRRGEELPIRSVQFSNFIIQ